MGLMLLLENMRLAGQSLWINKHIRLADSITPEVNAVTASLNASSCLYRRPELCEAGHFLRRVWMVWADGRENKVLSFLRKQESKNLERNDAPMGVCSKKCRSNTRCSVVRRVYRRAAASVFNASGCRREKLAPGCKNIRIASRTNQRIIMLNKGSDDKGFMVCKDCGASMPGDNISVLNDINRPYKSKFARNRCRHGNSFNVNLGYDS